MYAHVEIFGGEEDIISNLELSRATMLVGIAFLALLSSKEAVLGTIEMGCETRIHVMTRWLTDRRAGAIER